MGQLKISEARIIEYTIDLEIRHQVALLTERVKSYLATIDLITCYDQNAEYDPEEEEHHFVDPLGESRQRLLKKYDSYLAESKVDAHEIIRKYQGQLTDMDDTGFVIAITAELDKEGV